jgi:hypothetical protein
MLLYGYAIMKSRSGIHWDPMTKILAGRSANTCRNRIRLLMRNSVQRRMLYKLIQAWQTIYKRGIQTGELHAELSNDQDEDALNAAQEEDPYELGFDLTESLRYFFEQLERNPG